MSPSKEVAVTSQGVTASIDSAQTLKASKALLAFIKKAAKQKAAKSDKKNLLDDPEDEESSTAEMPIWLTLTTKRHIADSHRLKPSKISLPHPLNADETTICLISASPQRSYKNLIGSDAFPAELRERITRVIDIGKLKSKYGQYEAQRKLYSEHDLFLGDDRIINRLPKILGSTFYKTTTKRPIPVSLQAKAARVDGKRTKRQKGGDAVSAVNAGTPAEIAAEIEKAIGSALVSLTPTTNTAVRVGYGGFTPEKLAANVEAVAKALIEKHVPQKWQNVRSIYIKGPETAALPVWLTDELWLEEKDVVADGSEEAKAIKEKPNVGKKRKSLGATADETAPATKKAKKGKKEKLPEANDDKLDMQIAEQKAKLKKQKAKAKAAMDE